MAGMWEQVDGFLWSAPRVAVPVDEARPVTEQNSDTKHFFPKTRFLSQRLIQPIHVRLHQLLTDVYSPYYTALFDCPVLDNNIT